MAMVDRLGPALQFEKTGPDNLSTSTPKQSAIKKLFSVKFENSVFGCEQSRRGLGNRRTRLRASSLSAIGKKLEFPGSSH